MMAFFPRERLVYDVVGLVGVFWRKGMVRGCGILNVRYIVARDLEKGPDAGRTGGFSWKLDTSGGGWGGVGLTLNHGTASLGKAFCL